MRAYLKGLKTITIDIAEEDPYDSNELGDGGRCVKESNDTNIIDHIELAMLGNRQSPLGHA